MPADLVMAIEHAFRVCDWQENLVADEMPPQWMWPFDEELSHWFEEVDRKRKKKYGGGDESEAEDNNIDGPSMDNELAKDFR